MGEYADLYNEQGMDQYLHDLDNWDDEFLGDFGGEDIGIRRTCSSPKRIPEYLEFTIKKILKETEKGIFVELSGGAKHWLPKSQVVIEKKKLRIPQWLFDAKQEQSFEKMRERDAEIKSSDEVAKLLNEHN